MRRQVTEGRERDYFEHHREGLEWALVARLWLPVEATVAALRAQLLDRPRVLARREMSNKLGTCISLYRVYQWPRAK